MRREETRRDVRRVRTSFGYFACEEFDQVRSNLLLARCDANIQSFQCQDTITFFSSSIAFTFDLSVLSSLTTSHPHLLSQLLPFRHIFPGSRLADRRTRKIRRQGLGQVTMLVSSRGAYLEAIFRMSFLKMSQLASPRFQSLNIQHLTLSSESPMSSRYGDRHSEKQPSEHARKADAAASLALFASNFDVHRCAIVSGNVGSSQSGLTVSYCVCAEHEKHSGYPRIFLS